MTYSNLLPLASIACLHDPHQVRMFSLLLGLGTSSSRSSNIDSILGHDGETWQAGLVDL